MESYYSVAEPRAVYTSKAPIDVACMGLALVWAQLRSKDPNSKVAACVYHPKSGALFLGYNGFPAGIPDLKSVWDQRDTTKTPNKYQYVVHAETNAIRKAFAAFNDLSDCILYITHFPCRHCMKDSILPSGIKHVVYMSTYPPDAVSEELARIAGIELVQANAEFMFKDETNQPWSSGTKIITITDE